MAHTTTNVRCIVPVGLACVIMLLILSACTSGGRCDQSKKEPSLGFVPIFPGAVVIESGTGPNTDYIRTQLSTTAEAVEVLQWYKEVLASEGFNIDRGQESNMELEGGYSNCCHYGSVFVSLEQPRTEKGQAYIVTVYTPQRWQLCE